MPDDGRPRLVTLRIANHRLARADDGTATTRLLGGEEWEVACGRLLALVEERLGLTVRFAGRGVDRAEPAGTGFPGRQWYTLVVEAYDDELDGLEQALRALVGEERLAPAWMLVAESGRNPVVAELPRLR